MGLAITQRLVLPVKEKIPTGAVLNLASATLAYPVGVFQLIKFHSYIDAPFAIYEHIEGNCKGCGCPPFAETSGEIPDEIIEHLMMHLQFCSHFWPTKRTQDSDR